MTPTRPHTLTHLEVSLPDWIGAFAANAPRCTTDEQKMQLTIELARANVEHGTGGPFGAIVFDAQAGRAVAYGVNSVARLKNSVMHAEVMALMLAEAKYGSYSLRAADQPRLELFSSCEPCAMCLGAVLWSGIARLVCAATPKDATLLGFDEGPVTPHSWEYVAARGTEVVRGVAAGHAREVMALYRERAGLIYDPRLA